MKPNKILKKSSKKKEILSKIQYQIEDPFPSVIVETEPPAFHYHGTWFVFQVPQRDLLVFV